ncbi:MAG: GDP-L-fucose synthase family protein [Saprospiraceae bacterium]
MKKTAKIYVAGHRGMVGSALVRKLRKGGYEQLILRSSKALDLRNQAAVFEFFRQEQPDYVFLAAAKVGGILANNQYRADFIYDNLMIGANVIHASYLYEVKKLLFLGSSCIYPKMAKQPMKEEALLSGYLEHTNEPYAIAKIAGIKLVENYRTQHGSHFISAMPTNLYGSNDNYHLQHSHVLPALMRKFHEAKINNLPSVEIWGTGSPYREFMHVDDLVDACLFLMNNYDENQFVNVGTGKEITILELAKLIKRVVQYDGELKLDTSKPDGTPRKLMDSSRLRNLGWKPSISLETGIRTTYLDFQEQYKLLNIVESSPLRGQATNRVKSSKS